MEKLSQPNVTISTQDVDPALTDMRATLTALEPGTEYIIKVYSVISGVNSNVAMINEITGELFFNTSIFLYKFDKK